jgi:branched-subunit amino acid transport protein
MTASWVVIIVLAVGTALIKGAGAAVGGRRGGSQSTPTTLDSVMTFLPPALLAGLIVTDTFTGASHQLGVDARTAGLAAAGIAVFCKAPMIVVIVVAVVVTAFVKALA